MNSVNLMPARRRLAKARKHHLLRWATGLSLYAALLAVGYLCCRQHAHADVMGLEREGQRLTLEMNVNARLVQALRDELAKTNQKLCTAQAVGQQPDWGTLLDLLSRNVGEDVTLEICRLRRIYSGADGGLGEAFVLETSGLARTQADVSACVLRLEQTGLFDRVKLIKTSRHTFQAVKVVAFDLECSFQGGGGSPK